MRIPFNKAYLSGNEIDCIQKAIENRHLSGDGMFTTSCESLLGEFIGQSNCLLTTSCTHALEMAALLLDIKEGDEIIMPSFTFVSSANPFVLRGAKIIFIDIKPENFNIDEDLIEDAINRNTRAILVMHYAGVACNMNRIVDIANSHGIYVIEDAAHAIDSYYQEKHLGTIGHLGAISFHASKNINCGEGGALIINDDELFERAKIIREKGTNRQAFLAGKVDKYTWVDIGSSYVISELNAAFLYPQLSTIKTVTQNRLASWNKYQNKLNNTGIECMPDSQKHNGHIFYIKCGSKEKRDELIQYLNSKGISSAFHYVPLHSSDAGKHYGRFHGKDNYTTTESERMLRLPLFYGFEQAEYVAEEIIKFQTSHGI